MGRAYALSITTVLDMKTNPPLTAAQKHLLSRGGIAGLVALAFYFVSDFEVNLKPVPSLVWGSFSCFIKEKL